MAYYDIVKHLTNTAINVIVVSWSNVNLVMIGRYTNTQIDRAVNESCFVIPQSHTIII